MLYVQSPLANKGRAEHVMGPERVTLRLTLHPQCTGLQWPSAQTFRPLIPKTNWCVQVLKENYPHVCPLPHPLPLNFYRGSCQRG